MLQSLPWLENGDVAKYLGPSPSHKHESPATGRVSDAAVVARAASLHAALRHPAARIRAACWRWTPGSRAAPAVRRGQGQRHMPLPDVPIDLGALSFGEFSGSIDHLSTTASPVHRALA